MHLLYIDPHPVPDVCPEAMQILLTVDALAQIGCQVTLATPAPAAGRLCEEVLGRALHPGVEFMHLQDLRAHRWMPIRSGKFFYRAAARFVAATPADGILVRNLKLAEALLALPQRPPLVFETHEVFARTYAEDHPLPGWRERRKLAALRRREGSIYARSNGIAALTPWLLDDLRAEYGVKTPGVVVPDGVDLQQAATVHNKSAWSDPPVLLYLGSLHPWKGLEYLLAALPQVAGAKLHIAGGPDSRIAELRRQAQALGVAERIHFLGRIPPEQRFQIIADADICLLPLSDSSIASRYTSPLKLFEYMAVGKPIVAADVPALRLVIRDNENGILVPVGDVEKMANKINFLLKNQGEADFFGSAAKKDSEKYTWVARAGILSLFFQSI